jgi:hypothetical protein
MAGIFNEKNEHCLNIERLIGKSLDISHTDIVCKFCNASVYNALRKLDQLRSKFKTTTEAIEAKFEKKITKRMNTDSPQKVKKKSKGPLDFSFSLEVDKENRHDTQCLGVAPLSDSTTTSTTHIGTQTGDDIPGEGNVLYKVSSIFYLTI